MTRVFGIPIGESVSGLNLPALRICSRRSTRVKTLRDEMPPRFTFKLLSMVTVLSPVLGNGPNHLLEPSIGRMETSQFIDFHDRDKGQSRQFLYGNYRVSISLIPMINVKKSRIVWGRSFGLT